MICSASVSALQTSSIGAAISTESNCSFVVSLHSSLSFLFVISGLHPLTRGNRRHLLFRLAVLCSQLLCEEVSAFSVRKADLGLNCESRLPLSRQCRAFFDNRRVAKYAAGSGDQIRQ
jgi:hypothetical protein